MVTEQTAAVAAETSAAPAPTPEVVTDVTPQEPAAAATTASPEGQAAAGTQAPAPYQVNPVVKVRNMEKRFDDFVLPFIKDAETEKKFRELYERAYGLDFVKADREHYQGELRNLKQQMEQHRPTLDAVERIVHFRDQGQMLPMFQLLGIEPQKVFQWAYQYAQMSPEARQAQDMANTNAMNAYDATSQATSAQQQAFQQAAEFKGREYDMIMRYDTSVSAAASDFDQQHGPGAFFEQVKRTGLYHWNVNKRDIPVSEAVDEVMKLIGRARGQSVSAADAHSPGQMQQNPAAAQVAQPQAPTPKPVIPSVKGSGATPVKKAVTSIADMRRLARELAANE